MYVVRLTPAQWANHSADAHKIAFGEVNDPTKERIDFALVVHEGEELIGYVTCRELDGETLYWQFGGAFPTTKGTLSSWSGYQALARYSKELGYKRISTRIENTNTVMLKMAMKLGYRIQGLRYYNGSILLEHLLELQGGV